MAPEVAGLRFLVVEDHAFQRKVVVRILQRLGAADVLEAGDGHAALQCLREAGAPVHVVITDLDMPGMDGIEFLRHVGTCPRAPAVILASAMDAAMLASVQTMARAYGVDLLGVVGKPMTDQVLLPLLARRRDAQAEPAPVREESASVGDIREALRRGEFEAWFQPKVDMRRERVVGFEALARWRRADGRVVAPAGFLAVVESEGLADALTWCMLEQAGRFVAGLHARDDALKVSVNVSVASLADAGLVQRAVETTLAAGLEPRQVILEITESAAVGDALGPVLENLNRLRLRGFGLSIDDCGTGYASFQQLARIPFTELKIDRSFVRDAATQHASMVLLQASLDIARKLELVSVAEGVETRAEWDLLHRLGCDVAQGFGIARPMPAEAAVRWLHEGERVPRR